MGFPFLFAICSGAMMAIFFVNIPKGREDCRKFAEQRKMDRVTAESGLDANDIAKGTPSGSNDHFTGAGNE